MDMDAAIKHCTKGIGIWDWASTDEGAEPEVVLATAGDIPMLESLAASVMLREAFPNLTIRFINGFGASGLDQQSYARKMMQEYIDAGIDPS